MPQFVPDDIDVCDHCLVAGYELGDVYDSCSCGHYSDQVGYRTEDVLRVLRGDTFRRYYTQMRYEYAVGTPVVATSFIGLYDSDDPWPRTPLDEWPYSHTAWLRAQKQVKELNSPKGEGT